jgi:hypothetical protein
MPETQSQYRSDWLFFCCVVLGTACIVAGALLYVAERNLFNADRFARRAHRSLSDPRVAEYAATLVTDTAIRSRPDLIAFRPLILASARNMVQARPFGVLVEMSAKRAHEALLSESARRVVLTLPDLQLLVQDALQQANPTIADRVPKQLNSVVARFGEGRDARWVLELSRVGARLRVVWPVLLFAGVLLMVIAIWAAPDRQRGFFRLGIALVVGGSFLMAVLPTVSIALGLIRAPLDRGLARGLARAYLSDLTTWGFLLAALGAILAAGAASLLETFHPLASFEYCSRLIATPPGSISGRLLWSACLLALAALLIVYPFAVLQALATLAGLWAAFAAFREIFRVVHEKWSPRVIQAQQGSGSFRVALVSALTVAVAAGLGIGAWLWLRDERSQPAEAAEQACNGFPELCDRPLSAVVFAGTHNSMSNQSIPDWMFPQQEASIPQQLRDGIRALLFDVHYGFPGASRIKTDLAFEPNAEKMKQAVGEQGYEAALRIRNTLVGADTGQHRLYLCHGFCELGASALEPTLRDIRDFLVLHPDEVLLLDIEDYVAPQELSNAFQQAGLADFVYKGPQGPPWPTLRQLIASGQRAVVVIESGKPGVPWLFPAYPTFRETPYTFHNPDDFSCRPNRGGDTGSLFLLNHWIDTVPTPKPSNAAIVNAYSFLLARAEECESQRKHITNIVAVDFYRTGDLLRVVEHLNGVDQTTASAGN